MQNRKPMVLVLAGPNGSGKSTITTFFEKVGKYTNADDIVASTGMDNMEALQFWLIKCDMSLLKRKRILPLKQYCHQTISWKY